MDYKDLQNLSYLTRQVISESTQLQESYLDKWPYTSPYLEEEYVDEERAPGVKPYRPSMTQAEVRADEKAARKKQVEKAKGQEGYGPEDKFKSDWKLRAVPSSKSKRKDGTEETVSQRMDREAPYKTRPFSPLFTKQGSRTASAVTRAIEGPGEPQSVTMPRKGREEAPKRKAKPSREIIRKGKQEESFDLYDLIFAHLVNEGFAETPDAAIAIMSNMSEAWVDSIVDYYIEG
jgi:hypothetical protein